MCGHQDDEKAIEELDSPAKLNKEVDIDATTKARTPINTHLLSAFLAIYINERYFPYQFEHELRLQHFSEKAKQFLMHKYEWTLQTFQSINWQSHDKIIRDTRYIQKRFIKRFIHNRPPVGKMNFTSEHRCPYCVTSQNQNTTYDHFLQYNSLHVEKKKWMENLRTALSQHFTPPNLREVILDRLFNYYDSKLQDSNKIDFEKNHSYDSRSDSDERTATKKGQRRIIDQDSVQNIEDESSISCSSNASQPSNPWRSLVSRIEVPSLESDESFFEKASLGSKENSTHQDCLNHSIRI